MRELEEKKDIQEHLREFSGRTNTTVLIIDGKTLDNVFKNEDCEHQFFDLAIKAPCVCVCRCSPTQKAKIC
jgi:magnesium-transporting ATPase (P-type)